MIRLPKALSILVIIAFATNINGQHIEESKITCSHANTAKSFSIGKIKQSLSQSEFDVTFYDIDLIVYPDQKAITGLVGITGLSLVDDLAIIEIDLRDNINVNSVVTSAGAFLNFTHENDLITVELLTILSQNQEFTIIIHYNGQPQATGYGSFDFGYVNVNNVVKPMISTLSEPYGARDWWPCKDSPLDKADSVDISVKVPNEFIVASNGLLVGEEVDGEWKTYHWEERYPIATYLVSVAIHPYTVFYDWYKYSPTDSMRIEYYVYSSTSIPSGLYSQTTDMLHAFAPRFGEYPFIDEKYGHAQFTWSGSMEHQTLSSMGYNQTERTVAHELAHQWWGDMVTCSDFHHIWLNEGFATYSEALWYEVRDNDIESLHNAMYDKAVYYFDNPHGRYGNYSDSRIYVADTTSQSRIFDYSLTYQKAAWVMHMLRHVVGETAFFNGLQEYGNRYRFKSAVTEEFRDVMEAVSGMDLDSFFEQWIYGELYPKYSTYYNILDNGDLFLKVIQTDIENRQIFTMPVDIVAICDDNTELSWTINNDREKQIYTLDVPVGKNIKEVKFDPEHWILCKASPVYLDNTLSINDNNSVIQKFKIGKVFPNPFNSTVNISLDINHELNLAINIYDITGKSVWDNKLFLQPGNHNVLWNGKNNLSQNLPSGTYLIEVSTDKLAKYKKLLLLK